MVADLAQLLGELRGALVAARRHPLQQAGHGGDELRAAGGDLLRLVLGLAPRDLLGDARQVPPLEQAFAHDELVQHRPDGEEVRGRPEVAGAAPHLRRDVARRALDDAAGRRLDVQGRLHQAPVRDLQEAPTIHQHVGRLQVAVDDVEELALLVLGVVRVVEGLAEIDGCVQGRTDGDLDPLLAQGHEQRVQVRPVHELHRDEELALFGADPVHVDHAGVLEATAHAGFVDQRLLLGLHLAGRRLEQLERLALGEAQLAGLHDLPHLGGRAASQRAFEPVGAELVARFVNRCFGLHGSRDAACAQPPKSTIDGACQGPRGGQGGREHRGRGPRALRSPRG